MKRRRVNGRIVALVLISGISLGVLGAVQSSFERSSQVAAGAMADMQCLGGKDAHCPCGKGLDPKTGKCGNVSGGGKIGCPCKDITSGDEAASGKCAQVGKCLADKADGKPPELPQLPQPKPGGGGGEPPPENCAQSSGATSSTDNPNCPPTSYGAQEGGNLWGSVWDGGNLFASPDDASGGTAGSGESKGDSKSAWSNLLKSLGLSSGSDSSGTNANDSGSVGTVGTAGLSGTSGVSSQSSQTAETASGRTDDFARSASTFSYSSETNTGDTASALSKMAATLRSMLAVVRELF